MSELNLPVVFKGEELELPVKMFPYGWSYRIAVMVGEQELLFEPDEEDNLRAIGNSTTDPALMRAVAQALENLRKC